MKLRLKKLNSAGVAHHLGLVLVVVVLVASFGAYRIIQSNAATQSELQSSQQQPVNTQKKPNGCIPGKHKVDGSCRKYSRVETLKADCKEYHLQYDSGRNECKDACVSGFHRNDGTCVRNRTTEEKKAICAAERRQWQDGQCADKCIAGWYMKDGKCVELNLKQECDVQHRKWDNGKCTTECKDGWHKKDGKLPCVERNMKQQCESWNRKWVDGNTCGPCKDGFRQTDAFQCEPSNKKVACDAEHKRFVNGYCTNVCKTGWVKERGQCIRPSQGDDETGADGSTPVDPCPEGQVSVGSSCQPLEDPGESNEPVVPDVATPKAFKVTVYKDTNFKGESKTFTSEQAELPDGWNDEISSFKIQRGRWQICEDVNYQTNCTRRWASDPDLTKGKQDRNDKISSLRPVVRTVFEDATADVDPTCTKPDGGTVEATEDGLCPEGSQLSCPESFTLKNGECKEGVIREDAIVPVDKSFKGKDGEFKCKLIGREWIGEVKGKVINGGEYGCSMKTCRSHKDGAPRQFKDGPVCISNRYDKPYAEKLGEKQCENLHRIYVKQVKRCAMVPNRKDKDQTIVRAEQCEKSYSTYFIYKAKDKRDECFKPSFFDRVEGVVQVVGGWIGTALQQGPRGWCNVAKGGNYHWADGKCKIDRKTCWNGKSIPVTGNCPAQPNKNNGGGDGQDPGSSVTAAFCDNLGRPYVNGTCARSCKNKDLVLTNYSDPSVWDKCVNPTNNTDNNDGVNDCSTIRQCDGHTAGGDKCTDGRVRVNGGCWRLLDATSDPIGCSALSAYAFYKNGRCYGY